MSSTQSDPLFVESFKTQLVGGDPHGIRLCRFDGRPMLALIVPRGLVKKAKALPDIPSRGVYYLLGMENRMPRRVYAGQTVQGVARLESHLSAKDWWDVAVMFLALDPSFSKDVIDGLESMMVADARQYAFCQVDNGNVPSPHVSPYNEGLISDFFGDILWCMEVLGYGFSNDSGLPPDLGVVNVGSRKKNPPFNFADFGIAEGAILEFYDAKAGETRPSITATVCGPRKIRYKGKATSMSAVAKRVMKYKSSPSGPEFWTYNGRRLIDIYRERYPSSRG